MQKSCDIFGYFSSAVLHSLHRFSELVAGIEWFAEARQLSDTSAIWLDLAAYRHGIAGEMFRPEPGRRGEGNGVVSRYDWIACI